MEYKIHTYTLKLVKDHSIKYACKKTSNQKQAVYALKEFLKDRDCEHMATLMIDSDCNIIGMSLVGMGAIDTVRVCVRDIFKTSIVANARFIILGHNHPSGNVKPSDADIKFTSEVHHVGQLLGIGVLDHIIVSSGLNDDYYSFAENNRLCSLY